MSEGLDLWAILLWIAVIAVFGLFFALVAIRFWGAIRTISALIEAGPERRRQRLALAEKQPRAPIWQQALRRLSAVALFLVGIALIWFGVKGD